MGAYVSSQPWSPERPETLVVCCSDGRYHQHIEEFVRARVSERADLFVVPGGPAAIDPWSSSFDQARVFEESLRLFLSQHEISAVWLIAHQGCGFYRAKYGLLSEEELAPRQIQDLSRARERLRALAPQLEVRLWMAALEGERVSFTPVGEG
jgi:carbonic anhydrase